MEVKTSIREFLAKYFPNYDLQEDEDIFKLGFVNSLFAMQLVTFVEREFAITVDNDDLEISNFRTINALNHLIERKKGLVD